MKKLSILFLLFWVHFITQAQVVTVIGGSNTTPALSSSYASLASAITDLNSITGISGPVVITLNTGNNETAPAGGYEVNFTAATTASNHVIIEGSEEHNTITANASHSSGSITDAIFKLVGVDYVTIRKFTMVENSSNTTHTLGSNDMTEWGVALLRGSTTNGAQNNVIEDNEISLDRTYANSFGIYSNPRHAATTPATAGDIANGTTGPNHNNKIYNNRISNVAMGIAFIGSNTDSRMDEGNDIGGTLSTTGNSITEWGSNSLPTATFTGNFSTEYFGILTRCQKNVNVSWNVLVGSSSLSGAVAAPVRGIHNGNTTTMVTGTFTTTITNNTVSITDNLPNGSSSVSRVDGILSSEKLASGTLYITDNVINGISVIGVNSNRQIRGITNTASAESVYINNNIVKGNSSTATALGGWFIGIDQTGSVTMTLEINNNKIGESSSFSPAITYSATASPSTIVRGLSNIQSSNPTGTLSISLNNNSLYGFVQANTPTNSHVYIYCDHTTTQASEIEINGNEFVNIDAHIQGDVTFIASPGAMAINAGAQLSVSNNRIVGGFTKSVAGGEVYLYRADGASSTGNTMIEEGNDFSNITMSGSAIMHGWYNAEGLSAAGPEKHITNNVFENWICGTSGSTASKVIYCNWASGNSTISGNQVRNASAPANLDGILNYSTTAGTLQIVGNKIEDLKTISLSGSITSINLIGSAPSTNVESNIISNSTSTSGSSAIGIKISSAAPGNSIYLNYNSVYQAVTSTNPTFFTASLYLTASANPVTDRAYIRNNLFIDRSTPGTSGLTTAIWRTGTEFANYDPSSNNNVLYTGTPDIRHLILYDQTNSYQQLSDYLTRLASVSLPTAEMQSLSIMPDFVSLTPGSLDLHLKVSAANCPIFNHGNNEGILQTFDAFDLTRRMVVWPYITDIGADQVILTNIWRGTVSNDWNTAGNWSLAVVPNSNTVSAYIPRVAPRPQPVISSSTISQVSNVMLQTGVTLPLLTNNGNLKIADELIGDDGSLTNVGSGIQGSIELNGFCGTQRIEGDILVGNDVNNFTASVDVNVEPSPSSGLDIHGELGFGSATNTTLTTGDNVTLVSNQIRTANVAQIDATNFISGDVTVERYINTGTGTGQHSKKWQALATPTGANSTSQSVYDSWMEGGNNISTGFGTHIPDPSYPANGFDASAFITSIKTYNPTSGGFDPIANTGIPLLNKNGYFLFVRGDRSVDDLGLDPNPTNLRSKGSLFQPQSGYQPPSVSVPAGFFQLVGNPYASAIDIEYMAANGYFTNLSNDVIVWDPLLPGSQGLGGYQTLVAANNYEPTPGGTTTLYISGTPYTEIQSGQAFFVESPSTAGTVTFDESIKTSNHRLVTRQPINLSKRFLRTSLYANEMICDGVASVYSGTYNNDIDADDAGKLLNPSESFMIQRHGKLLSVEACSEISGGDSIFYAFKNLSRKAYRLGFAPVNFRGLSLEAKLIDNYLKTEHSISLLDSTVIEFIVDEVKASSENRFVVVFYKRLKEKLDEMYSQHSDATQVVVFPNPVESGKIGLLFKKSVPGLYTLGLFNSSGQLVYKRRFSLAYDVKTLSFTVGNKISRGSYELQILDPNGKVTTKQVFCN